jgi:hypothetical protein
MPSPKDNEQKLERMLNAWRALAPDKSFGGMTLAQFEAAAAPAIASRRRIETLEDQLRQEIATREREDDKFAARAQLAVVGVLADPTEGADSALNEAFSYTRKSDLKTGLTRRKRDAPPAK